MVFLTKNKFVLGIVKTLYKSSNNSIEFSRKTYNQLLKYEKICFVRSGHVGDLLRIDLFFKFRKYLRNFKAHEACSNWKKY